MSIIFGYILNNKVYLASDNRITDVNGNFISDKEIKIEVVNNNTAVAFAGNGGSQSFFMRSYKDMDGYKSWFANDLASSVWSMCNAIVNMNTDWAKIIASSNSCFLIAGKTKDNNVKLYAITLKNKHIDLKEVPMMLFHPNDCDFQNCANILCKNVKHHPDNFSKYVIDEISQISKLVSNTGNVWIYDLEKDESKFMKI